MHSAVDGFTFTCSKNKKLKSASKSWKFIRRYNKRTTRFLYHAHTLGSADPERGLGQNNEALWSCGSTYDGRGGLRQPLLHAHAD